MKIVGREIIVKYGRKHASAEKPLKAWLAEVEKANWQSPHDLKTRYPSADTLGDGRTIFNIKGNDFRLVVRIRYQNGIVRVEWIGSHAEYDKRRF